MRTWTRAVPAAMGAPVGVELSGSYGTDSGKDRSACSVT